MCFQAVENKKAKALKYEASNGWAHVSPVITGAILTHINGNSTPKTEKKHSPI